MARAELTDLHRHLDGSLRPETALSLAKRLDVPLPSPLEFRPGIGLEGALARFEFTLRLMQEPEVVRQVASEACEDALAEGVTTLELRFAPQLHGGGSMGEVVDAALEGIADRAGLVLCGLYGESPEVLGQLVDAGAPRAGVVGIDLAGGPQTGDGYRLEDYSDVFHGAAGAGLGRTVHAAEGRSPQEIAVAIEKLGAQRIGHGTTILEAPDVVALVREREVTLEACVTSNVHTGVIEDIADHPLPRWIDLGLRVCVCADNTLFSRTDAAEELRRVATIPGMDEAKLDQVVAEGHRAAFRRSDR